MDDEVGLDKKLLTKWLMMVRMACNVVAAATIAVSVASVVVAANTIAATVTVAAATSMFADAAAIATVVEVQLG
jgi:hypothetical protein